MSLPSLMYVLEPEEISLILCCLFFLIAKLCSEYLLPFGLYSYLYAFIVDFRLSSLSLISCSVLCSFLNSLVDKSWFFLRFWRAFLISILASSDFSLKISSRLENYARRKVTFICWTDDLNSWFCLL